LSPRTASPIVTDAVVDVRVDDDDSDDVLVVEADVALDVEPLASPPPPLQPARASAATGVTFSSVLRSRSTMPERSKFQIHKCS